MKARLNYYPQFPDGFAKLNELALTLKQSTIDPKILMLIKIRASQINGCTFCIDMHSKEAKIANEKEIRLYHLAAWHESPLFTEQERAALFWTDILTKIHVTPVTDEIYAKVNEHFTDKEMVELTMAISIINTWNRVALSFRAVPGALDKAFGLEKAGL